MDIQTFLTTYFKSYTYKQFEDGYLVLTPIMYQGADHTFSFYIKDSGTGSFIISDHGQTLDYASENFDYKKYMDKINAVCERFGITLNGTTFEGRLASFESNQTMRNFHSFINAMGIIANIDLL